MSMPTSIFLLKTLGRDCCLADSCLSTAKGVSMLNSLLQSFCETDETKPHLQLSLDLVISQTDCNRPLGCEHPLCIERHELHCMYLANTELGGISITAIENMRAGKALTVVTFSN